MKDKELRKLLLDAGILEYQCATYDDMINEPTCKKKLYAADRTKVTELKIELLLLTKRIEALEQKKKR